MMRIEDDDDGQRLDRWLKKKFPQIAFGQMQKLLRTGQIRIGGKRAKGDAKLSAGDEIRLPPMLSDPKIAAATSDEKDRAFIQSLVIYEDEAVVAINKPSGLAVQGGTGITRHVDGMLDGLTGANGVRPRLVHRIDKDTSGVLLLARSAESARRLSEAFASRDAEKIYWAITSPAPTDDAGRIDAPLAKGMGGGDIEKMLKDEDVGKSAITDWRVIARGPEAALVEFRPLTGRTHQIRAHAGLAGFPLWGDIKYGAKTGKHFYLHAAYLTLTHPKSGKTIRLEAPVSKDFEALCARLAIPFTSAD